MQVKAEKHAGPWWPCFHCRQVFDDEAAALHFGSRFTPEKLRRLPACVVERHPRVKALRRQVARLGRTLGYVRLLAFRAYHGSSRG